MRAARITRLTALVLALFCALPAWGAGAEGLTATAPNGVTLRSLPDEGSAAVWTVPAGGMVIVTGENGDYYQAVYEGLTGWALKQSLTVSGGDSGEKTAASAYAVLKKNSQGEAVKTLQTSLKALGYYTSTVDGKYGSGTAKAVTAFQKMNGLPETGVADAATLALLYDGAPKNSAGVAISQTASYETLQSGSRGDAVKTLQTRLKTLGYYTSSIDGKYGSGTAKAVTAFQKKNGISQTGVADAATQAALYSDAARSASWAESAATPTPTPVPTNAPTTGKATYPFTTYTLSSVNLRKKASTSSARILTISRGAEVSVLALSGDYAKVTYQGSTGYVVAEYINIPAQYLPGETLKEDAEARQHYPYLQSGSTGKNVQLLQEALTELGYYSGALDGDFGSATLTAFKAFEKKSGLKQDGVASPEIQKLIFEGRPLNSKGKRVDVKVLPDIEGIEMKQGDKGDQVTQLQQRLASLGYFTGTVGRTYDSDTVSAVKKFQKDHSLYVDGVAGTKTQVLLKALTATATPAAVPYVTVIAAPTATPQPAATALTAQNVTVLRSGAKGEAVKRLQERLMALGYYVCDVDGVYDADDIQAVKAFQQKNGLTIDGVAGLITQRALYADTALPATTAALMLPGATQEPYVAPTASPETTTVSETAVSTADVLKTGSRGEAVKQLQSKLKALGYYTDSLDGVYGSGTAKAVTAFQRKNGLTADGVAGAKTLAKLNAADSSASALSEEEGDTSPLKSGDRGDQVKALQEKLVALGYLSSADGIYGKATYQAVKAFQKKNGLSADGVAGQATLSRLASGQAVAAKPNASSTPAPTAVPPAEFRVPDASEVRYANWYSEIRARAKEMPDVVIYDPDSGLHFNLHMFSFGKHADCETPTKQDTEILYQINGKDNWTAKYVWVIFSDGRVYIGSIHSHGHEVDHTPNNGLEGHICLHFPRVMSEAEATGPYAVSHQNEINWGWELTKAMAK